MTNRIPLFLFAGLAWCAGAVAQPVATVDDYQAIDPAPPAARGETILAIEGFGQRWELQLRDHRAPFTRIDPERRASIEAGGARYLTGTTSTPRTTDRAPAKTRRFAAS